MSEFSRTFFCLHFNSFGNLGFGSGSLPLDGSFRHEVTSWIFPFLRNINLAGLTFIMVYRNVMTLIEVRFVKSMVRCAMRSASTWCRGCNLNAYLIHTPTCDGRPIDKSAFYPFQKIWYEFFNHREMKGLVGKRRSRPKDHDSKCTRQKGPLNYPYMFVYKAK